MALRELKVCLLGVSYYSCHRFVVTCLLPINMCVLESLRVCQQARLFTSISS